MLSKAEKRYIEDIGDFEFKYGTDNAKAKRVAQNTVSWRLKLHDETPKKVKQSIHQKLIDEEHIHEIMQLCADTHLSIIKQLKLIYLSLLIQQV